MSPLSVVRPIGAASVHTHIGLSELASPVVFAPMAGVISVVFHILCREQGLQRTGTVPGLYVCEMVTA